MIYDIKRVETNSYRDIDWSAVSPASLTANDGSSNTPYATEFQLCYNERGIFFRFHIVDDKINATMTAYNDPIYDEEVVELFFQTTEDKHRYLELEWNGIGGVFCGNIYNDLCGNTTIYFVDENITESDIYAEEDGWSVIGFIPVSLFENEMSGEWRFNAYRIKRDEAGEMIQSAFSPTLNSKYHTPDRFATLRFVK